MTGRGNKVNDEYFNDTMDASRKLREEIRSAKEMLKTQKENGEVPHINIGDNEDELEKNISEFPNLDGMHNIQIPDDWDGTPMEPIGLSEFNEEEPESNRESIPIPYKEDKVLVELTPEELTVIKNVLLRSVIDYKRDKYFSQMKVSMLDEVRVYGKLADDINEALNHYYSKKGYDPLLDSWKKKAVSEYEM